jgi:hypothetical protein
MQPILGGALRQGLQIFGRCALSRCGQILLHNTKAKVATAKDTFEFVGPGWEEESWSGDPGKWLSWLGANHLNGILTLEEFDPALYRQLAARPN